MSRPTIAGYQDLVEIGRGGYAVVYRAEQVALQRTVAIKVVSGSDVDATRVRRFERECAAIGSLSGHPHVVSVFDAGTTDAGMPYLSMEHLPRGSLGDRLRDGGSLEVHEVVTIGIQLCAALEAAHQRDVLHRDLKPENVLVGEEGRCKLADFGIAVVADATQHTATGTVVGTVKHSAPEVLAGDRATVASDVYSLGSTLFALLAGAAPFWRQGDESAVPAMLRAIRDPLPDLRARGVPEAVATAIETACAKEPDRRFPSAAAFGAALQQAQGRLGDRVTPMDTRATIPATTAFAAAAPAGGVPPGPGAAVPVLPAGSAPPVPADPVAAAPGHAPGGDRRRLAAVLGVLLAALAALVGVAVWRLVDDDGASPSSSTSAVPATATTAPVSTASSAATTVSTSPAPISTASTAPTTTASTTTAPTTTAPTTTASTTPAPSTTAATTSTTAPPDTAPTTTTVAGPGSSSEEEIARATAAAEAEFTGFAVTDASTWRGDTGVSTLVGEDAGGREKVFVFIDGRLAGSDYNAPSLSLDVTDTGANSFVIAYDLYDAGEDDACCAPIDVLRTTFTRDGGRMRPDQRSAPAELGADRHR